MYRRVIGPPGFLYSPRVETAPHNRTPHRALLINGESLRRRMPSGFLAGEVEDHGSIFVARAPGPGFGDVIVVLEAEDEMMLVARGRGWQISRALIVKAEFLNVGGRRRDAHAGLVGGGTEVHQRDAVAIDAVKRDHFCHAGSGELFQDGSARGQHFEAGFCGHAVVILCLPLAGERLQLLKGGFRGCSRKQRRKQRSEKQERHIERHKSAAGHNTSSWRRCVTHFGKGNLGHTPDVLFDAGETEKGSKPEGGGYGGGRPENGLRGAPPTRAPLALGCAKAPRLVPNNPPT